MVKNNKENISRFKQGTYLAYLKLSSLANIWIWTESRCEEVGQCLEVHERCVAMSKITKQSWIILLVMYWR